jgi:hypothetical protein
MRDRIAILFVLLLIGCAGSQEKTEDNFGHTTDIT